MEHSLSLHFSLTLTHRKKISEAETLSLNLDVASLFGAS